jgi:23S rRNA (adenine2503-C2)-methyltransferase
MNALSPMPVAVVNPPKTNLLGLDKKAMQDFFVSIGEKPYRADQILKWIHFQGVQDFEAMTITPEIN